MEGTSCMDRNVWVDFVRPTLNSATVSSGVISQVCKSVKGLKGPPATPWKCLVLQSGPQPKGVGGTAYWLVSQCCRYLRGLGGAAARQLERVVLSPTTH